LIRLILGFGHDGRELIRIIRYPGKLFFFSGWGNGIYKSGNQPQGGTQIPLEDLHIGGVGGFIGLSHI
jgi:hypothetical protein